MHNDSETTTDSFTYRVSDGINVSNLVTVSLTITPMNDAPTIAAIQAQSVEQGRTLTVTVSATDADLPAQRLIYSATGLPAGALFDAATRLLPFSRT